MQNFGGKAEYFGICEKRPIQTFKASKVIKARLLLSKKNACGLKGTLCGW